MPRPLPVGLFACLLVTSTLTAADKKPSPAQIEFFEKKIRPVLVKQCYSCHSAKAKILRGGLRLDNRQAVARVAKPVRRCCRASRPRACCCRH